MPHNRYTHKHAVIIPVTSLKSFMISWQVKLTDGITDRRANLAVIRITLHVLVFSEEGALLERVKMGRALQTLTRKQYLHLSSVL